MTIELPVDPPGSPSSHFSRISRFLARVHRDAPVGIRRHHSLSLSLPLFLRITLSSPHDTMGNNDWVRSRDRYYWWILLRYCIIISTPCSNFFHLSSVSHFSFFWTNFLTFLFLLVFLFFFNFFSHATDPHSFAEEHRNRFGRGSDDSSFSHRPSGIVATNGRTDQGNKNCPRRNAHSLRWRRNSYSKETCFLFFCSLSCVLPRFFFLFLPFRFFFSLNI